MKIVWLLAGIFFFNEAVFSQWQGNENPLSIKELHLSRQQQKKIRSINSTAASQIKLLQKNGENATAVAKIKGRRIKRLRACLTPEQQLTWHKKLMENKPRRGITGLPNEKAVQ